jgi:hypothetical protein
MVLTLRRMPYLEQKPPAVGLEANRPLYMRVRRNWLLLDHRLNQRLVVLFQLDVIKARR